MLGTLITKKCGTQKNAMYENGRHDDGDAHDVHDAHDGHDGHDPGCNDWKTALGSDRCLGYTHNLAGQ